VGLLEDWIMQNNLFELLDGCGTTRGPNEGCVLLGEFGQGFGNVGEAPDKRSLVTEHTQCAVDLFHSAKLFGPSRQTVAFRGVNADGPVADYYAQVLNRGTFEFAFGGLEEETLCLQEVEDVVDDASMKGQIVVHSDEDIIHIDKQHAGIFVFQGAK
jgi:hypothetical protein